MGKASSNKKRRAAVRSAKRAKNNNWWYALTAIVVVIGIALVVYARQSQPAPVGPYILDQVNQTNPHNKDSHWHAALGVYDCDKWLSDGSGDGVWNWPNATPDQRPARADNTNVYAGLHSHDDGIIHMEPAVSEEAGRHATVGKYFEYGGWKLSSDGYTFVSGPGNQTTTVKNGDQCAGKPGKLTWALAKFNGKPTDKQKYQLESGNPADYKLYNDDIVVLAFTSNGKTAADLGNPPSLVKLPDAASNEGQGTTNTTMPPVTAPLATTPNTATKATTPATTKP